MPMYVQMSPQWTFLLWLTASVDWARRVFCFSNNGLAAEGKVNGHIQVFWGEWAGQVGASLDSWLGFIPQLGFILMHIPPGL